MKSQLNFLTALIAVLFFTGCAMKPNYVGIWRSGTGSNVPSRFNSWEAFIADGNVKAREQGVRLIDFEFFEEDGEPNFVGIWRSGTGSNVPSRFNTWEAFIADGNIKTREQGLRLIDFEFFELDGTPNFVGIWRSGNGSNVPSRFNTWEAFIADGNIKAREQGLRLIDFEFFELDGTPNFVGIWRSGTGSNVPSRFNTWEAFIADGNIKAREQGLRLIDFEFFELDGMPNYVGIWRSGTGSNVPSRFETWEAFIADGNVKAREQGLRLIDFEFFYTKKISISPTTDDDLPPTPPVPDCAGLPEVPNYIEFTNDSWLEVDFTHLVGENRRPRIRIPFDMLPLLPSCDDEIIFPNNFCGIRVMGATRFLWQDDSGRMLGTVGSDLHPVYNSIPESQSLTDFEGGVHFFDGIEFSGPIGACERSNEGWNFPGPLTKTGTLAPSNTNVKLVIETSSSSTIEFINYNIRPEGINPHEFFKDTDYKSLKELAITFPEFFEIREFIRKGCEEYPTGCPIGESEKWW